MLGKEKYIEGALADKVYLAVLAMDQGNMIIHTWKSIHTESMAVFLRSILTDVFRDDNLVIYTKKVPNASEEAANTVLEMYLSLVDLGQLSYQEIASEETKYRFVYQLVKRIRENEAFLVELIKKLNNAMPLLANLTYTIVSGRGNSEVYLNVLVEKCPQICVLVDRIANYDGISFDVIDTILKTYVSVKKSCDKQVVTLYYKAYDRIRPANNNGCGIFETWFEVLNSNEMGMFCEEVYASGLSVAKKEDLFERMDNMLSFDGVTRVSVENINAISRVAQRLDVYSRTEELYQLDRNLSGTKSVRTISESLENFAKACVIFKDTELSSQYIKEMMKKAAIQMEDRVHFLAIFAFVFENSFSRKNYMQEYIKTALSCVKKNQILNQVIALCQAVNLEDDLIFDKERAGQAKRALNDQLVVGIVPFYKSSFMEQIKKIECDPVVKKNVMALLKEVDEKAPKGIGGFFNNIMGKVRKQ